MPIGRYKRGTEFPHEAFVQAAVEHHFESAGYLLDSGGRVDLHATDALSGERWHIEAKGVTSQVGLDFRTGLGQLVQGMEHPESKHAIAVPDTDSFRKQVRCIRPWVMERLQLYVLLVAADGGVSVYGPTDCFP